MFLYAMKGMAALPLIFAMANAYPASGSQMLNKSAYEDALEKMNHIRGVETCESIPASTYESFLIFAPSNMQTYYFRSSCFQQVAVQTRDAKLCDQVIERKAMLLDGSGISTNACHKAVLEQMNKDFAERVRPESIHKIERVELSTAPSGDIEVRVFPAGSLWGTYRFSVALVGGSGDVVGMLNELDTHLSDRKDPLFASVPRRKIEELAGSRKGCGGNLAIRASLKLLRDDKGQLQRSNLSPAQLESTFNQSLSTRDIRKVDCR
jgi:hypothetical protein